MQKNNKKPFGIMLIKEESKRLPRKNFMNFHGKPMFKHIHDAAKKTSLFNDIIISTESDKIINICKKNKIKIYFKRPDKLSKSSTSLNDVIKHAIRNCNEITKNSSEFCLLWATAPLVRPSDLINSYKIFKKKKSIQCVVGVKKNYEYYSTLTENKYDNFLSPIYKSKITNLRKQKLKIKYVINSSFAWIKKDNFLKSNNWLLPNALPYVMDSARSVDLDYPKDLEVLKIFAKKLNLK